jgi:hypothetical protein
MKDKLLLVLAMLGSMAGIAQVNDTVPYKRFLAEAGVRVPLGRLTEKMGPSPEFGLWYRTRIEHNDMLDLGISLYAPQGVKQFDYTEADSLYRSKAQGLSGMAGLRFCKSYHVPGRYNNSIEWVSSFGWGFFTYHDTPGETRPKSRPDRKPRNEYEINIETHTKSFSTIAVGQGIRYNIANFGLQAHYNYSPYGLFSGHVPKDFGSHSISIGICYRL